MLQHPDIDPVAFTLGPLTVHWYGILYLIGMPLGYWLLARRCNQPGSKWQASHVSDLIIYGAFGMILGARIGYVLFYRFSDFLGDPLLLIRMWEGGMSFHGGVIGSMIVLWFYGRNQGRSLFEILDFVVPIVPIGLGAGRLANFIGQDLWGRVTDVPWGMVFPRAGDGLARHPSQLYQAALEGLVLFIILWWFSSRPRPQCAVSGLFALCYGIFRVVAEFFRAPDAHIGYIAWGWLTMGQLLSLPLIMIGAALLWFSYRKTAR
jgi:phosphatidylglycerol:prolipoprotein diacylglycerol transferase